MDKNNLTTVILPHRLKTQLKILCALTNKRQSDFIRIAIQDKIKEMRVNGEVPEMEMSV